MSNSNQVAVIQTPPPAYRGGTPGPNQKFYVQSMNLTWAWGSEPGSATIEYLLSNVPVTINNWATITAFGHTFYGICESDRPSTSSSGTKRTLTFKDSRVYLDWDLVYGAFNKIDSRIVNGKRVRRYRHLLPANFNAGRWTFTTSPLTAREILDYIFSAATVEDPWVRTYHADQIAHPVYNCDFTNGVKLKQALQEITDKQGLAFTLTQASRFSLLWARKGEGIIPPFPADSDERDLGSAVSGNPTRVRILGDRNVYQVHNIVLQKDWAAAWEAYFDTLILEDAVYANGLTQQSITINGNEYPAGTPFASIGASADDPEQIIARQLSSARAQDITVREFAAMMNNTGLHDTRRFSGASRMDMPAMLYVKNVLFRAFKLPTGFRFRNANGRWVYPDSCEISNQMCAAVTHDPATGVMSWDINEPVDGRGYAIVKGYQIGKDLFRTLRPERFDLSAWTNIQSIWQHIEFQVDESGDSADQQFIVFDEPVIKSSDLIHWENGFATFKARPTITVPEVKISLPFLAERFSWVVGTGKRDDVEQVQGLCAEHVQHYNGPVVNAAGVVTSGMTEVPFHDGLYAYQKAQTIGETFLNRQFAFIEGGYTRHLGPNNIGPTMLASYMDRVSLETGPGGYRERISFTSERPRRNYVPESELNRRNRELNLIPGLSELRDSANQKRLVAAGLARDASTKKTVADALRGFMGSKQPDAIVTIKPTA